ncbi:MAG TPA: hypothetical protein VF815_34665, partial [Myxococcaceae bacterium]
MRATLSQWMCVVLVSFLLGCQQERESEQEPQAPIQRQIADQYGKLPMSFEANVGQVDAEARFVSRGPGYTLLLAKDRAALMLAQPAQRGEDGRRNSPTRAVALMLRAEGAHEGVIPQGEQPLEHPTRYFRGNDPEQWLSDVPSFSRVRYPEVYPGVDLVFYGNQGGQLEFDFVVAPGADPSAVVLRLEGAQDMETDAEGHLRLRVEGGEVRLLRPLVYQERQGERQVVASRYVLGEQG